MILQTFVVVLLRLLAIQAALGAIMPVASFVIGVRSNQPEWFWLIAMGINLGAAALLWGLAPLIGRVVCAKLPSSAAPLNASLVDLYSFAFVLVGLFLAMTSLGSALGWVHFMIANASADRDVNFYESFTSSLQVIIGVAFVFKARALAVGLARKHLETESKSA